MKTLKWNYFILIILCTIVAYGCTYTQSFPPDFNEGKAAVLDTLKIQYHFEDITFVGKKESGSGGDHSSLTIKFINGKDIPTNSAQRDSLGKQLGSRIKGIVKNPKEFDTFIILFDVVKTNGVATSENYSGNEFKVSEL